MWLYHTLCILFFFGWCFSTSIATALCLLSSEEIAPHIIFQLRACLLWWMSTAGDDRSQYWLRANTECWFKRRQCMDVMRMLWVRLTLCFPPRFPGWLAGCVQLGETPLHSAAWHGYVSIVRTLCAHDAVLDMQNKVTQHVGAWPVGFCLVDVFFFSYKLCFVCLFVCSASSVSISCLKCLLWFVSNMSWWD